MIPESAIQQIKSSLRGQIFCPRDQGYHEARTVPNAMIDRRPAVIARCAGAADVMACVRIAREHDVLVSVRGGGHSIAGKAVPKTARVLARYRCYRHAKAIMRLFQSLLVAAKLISSSAARSSSARQ